MLREFLPVNHGTVMALVGAGGKTTTMVRLGSELAATGMSVVLTTTTHICLPRPQETDHLVVMTERQALLAAVAQVVRRGQRVTVAADCLPPSAAGRSSLRRATEAPVEHAGHLFAAMPADLPVEPESCQPCVAHQPAHPAGRPGAKLRGIPPTWIADLRDLPGVDAVLVEADGAKMRQVKAPAAHEPALPPCTTLLLAVASATALGQPLDDHIAHRPERIAAVTGLLPGMIITPEALARLITSDDGALKGLPAGAGAWLLLTHITPNNVAMARRAATLALATGRLQGALLASLDTCIPMGPPQPPF
jgi:probable selenium-dependent hydroxylase accessory protein YqeC